MSNVELNLKETLKIVLYISILVISALTIYSLSISYNFNDFKDYVTIVLSISGMVFTIMGIWIAFLYPNALNRLVDPDKIKTADFSDSNIEFGRLEFIVGSVLKSALVMLSIMIIFLIKLLLANTSFYLENHSVFKIIVLSSTVLLSYIQIEAVVQVVLANISFITDLHQKKVEREVTETL